MTVVKGILREFLFCLQSTAESSTMFTKVLFAACALFVVAHATDIYAANWQGPDCVGTAESVKFTLDQCTNGGYGDYGAYFKCSLTTMTMTTTVGLGQSEIEPNR